MECGVAIGLDPLGGNQLNVRELLRRLHPEPSAASDDGSDAGMEDVGAGGVSAPEREPEPRRLRDDDYDYDDDFIDDAELVEEEAPDDDHAPYDESADEDFRPEEEEPEEEGVKGRPRAPPPVHHGFGRFFVNKGDIPTKAQLAPLPNPPDSIGNVAINIPGLRAPTPPPAKESVPGVKPAEGGPNPATAESGKKPPTASSTSPSGAPGAATPVAKKQKVEHGASSKSGKVIPPAVLTEIAKLERLCREEFGDKKPKMGDIKVQDQLSVFFREAMKMGVARLFSDIAKDRRVVALNDEVWLRLSRFIRTKRATIETLGHALHWRTKEIDAKARVTTTEARVDALLEKQREAWPARAAGEQLASDRPVTWSRELDERLFDWYSARSDLQIAKNQLGARVRSIKKSMPGWVSALKNRAFAGFAVGDQEVIDSFRRIEEERAALERQKREAERAERKRKKEEQAAAIAAKKAAIANAKGAPTPAPVPASGGASPVTPPVTKVVPKPKNVAKNGGPVKNGGAVKAVLPTKNGGSGKNGTGVKSGGAAKSSAGASKNGGAAAKSGSAVKNGGAAKAAAPKSSASKSPSTKPVAAKTSQAKATPAKAGSAAKVTPVKTAGGKATAVSAAAAKTTPVKTVAPKQGKNAGARAVPSPVAQQQKQTKLTALVKKNVKSEGNAAVASKAGGSTVRKQAAIAVAGAAAQTPGAGAVAPKARPVEKSATEAVVEVAEGSAPRTVAATAAAATATTTATATDKEVDAQSAKKAKTFEVIELD